MTKPTIQPPAVTVRAVAPPRGDYQPIRVTQRERSMRRRHNLGHDEYDDLFDAQDGLCAICQRSQDVAAKLPSHPAWLVMDHDHDTGKVRGLLCNRCNALLGQFGDTLESLALAIEWVERATRYLEKAHE